MRTLARCSAFLILVAVTAAPRGVAEPGPGKSDPFDWVSWKHSRPFIEILYGYDAFKHKRFAADLPTNGALDVRLGYLSAEPFARGIVMLDDRFAFASFSTPDLGSPDESADGLLLKMGRFGLGNRRGYGYDFEGGAVVPYFGASLVWSEVQSERPVSLGDTDREILNRYEGTFRFGTSAEGGVRINIGQTFSVIGGYELAVVYPRHVFWEWTGSFLLAAGSVGLVSHFAEEILETSPALGPVIMLVLKCATAFGVYQLWREEMNWPFNSETPLTHEFAKVGFNLTF